MIEIYWGEPLSLISPAGEHQDFSTFEKARHWLRHKWPTDDAARNEALTRVEAAMDCLAPASSGRQAFAVAARQAGFVPAHAERPLFLRAA